MELIGFIALVLFSLYLLFSGAVAIYVIAGFSGRFTVESWVGLFLIIAGCLTMYYAISNAPFTMVINKTA